MQTRLTVAVVILVALCASRETQANDDWTGWLGPNRNDWVSSFQPPAKWPATLTKVW